MFAFSPLFLINVCVANEECNAALRSGGPTCGGTSNSLECGAIGPGAGFAFYSVMNVVNFATGEPQSCVGWHTCDILMGSTINIPVSCREIIYPENSTSMCPPPHKMNTSGKCVAYCSMGTQWDASTMSCVGPPVKNSCATQSGNPIDFISGRKFRTEKVISIGKVFPIELKYFYNNFANQTKAISGSDTKGFRLSNIGAHGVRTFLASEMDPISIDEYKSLYGESGRGTFATVVPPFNMMQTIERHWRHNYEEFLTQSSAGFTWYGSQGIEMVFDANGKSNVEPILRVSALSNEEMQSLGFSGHKLSGQGRNTRYFDSLGRLKKLLDPVSGRFHNIEFDSESHTILAIVHSSGERIEFEYVEKPMRSSFHLQGFAQDTYLPNKVSSSAGLHVELSWDQEIINEFGNQYLITKKTDPTFSQVLTGREYEYDSFHVGSIKNIYRIRYQPAIERKLYASFKYDGVSGKAIYSSLANGVDAVAVEYTSDTETKVTNALGKTSVYSFTVKNGVKRLTKVTGEPTENCVQTETQFTYDGKGLLEQKDESGVITKYSYDDEGREISRTEAYGTSNARTTETEWNDTFNLPNKITRSNLETSFEYYPNGKLKSKTSKELN